MSNHPFLSIIIPVYNVEEYLPTCLDSILQQEFTNYEIILVDDGSRDDSSVICDSYAQKHAHIHCIHQKNAGHTAARQAGFLASKGTYVAFADSDDWVTSDMYTKMCKAAQDTNADIIHCDFIAAMPDKQKKCSIPFASGLYDKEKLIETVYPKMIYSGTYFTFGAAPNLWNKLFKRALLEKALFQIPHDIIVGEDGLITYSCMLAADSIYFTDEAYYYYRSIGTSLCHNMNTKRLSENHIMFETYDKLIDLNSYPMLKKQLHYFFAYQSLLTIVPIFQALLQKKEMPAVEVRRLFLSECKNSHIKEAFAHVKLKDIKGSRNKIYAFCIRHKLYWIFAMLLGK